MIRRALNAAWWSFLTLVAKKAEVRGVRVWHFLPIDDEAERCQTRLEGALALVEEYAPYIDGKLRELASGILFYDHPMLYGTWRGDKRVLRLSTSFVVSDEGTPERIACVIVHEIAHARLQRAGVSHDSKRIHRIEAICHRAEAAFARRLPEGGALAEEHEALAVAALDDGPARWSPGARLERDAQALEILEAPAWLIRAVRRRAARRSA